MRKLLSFILAILMCAALLPVASMQAAHADERYLEINEMNFPDDNFRQWVIDNLPHEGDAASGYYMTKAQMDSITEINCSDRNIRSLVGIELFTALTELDCSLNQLTALDVSKNTELWYLNCGFNQLSNLDVDRNTALQQLLCNNNLLTTLNVSRNSVLWLLFCDNNDLTALDLGSNAAIETLGCYENHLSVLNVGHLTSLSDFQVGRQTIPNQEGGYADGQYYYDLTNIVPKEMLQNIRIVNIAYQLNTATGIVYLPSPDEYLTYYYDTGYLDMDVTVYLNYSVQGSDRYLDINETNFPDNHFRQWVIDNLPHKGDISSGYYMTETQTLNVIEICCPVCSIQSLVGIEYFTALKTLSCQYNQLTVLDVSRNTALENLNCEYNQLTVLDVSNNTALVGLDLESNQLTTLDVSKNTTLESLDCSHNQLTSLDISNNTVLTDLWCGSNQLITLDVSKNTALNWLNCDGDKLAALDVSKNSVLKYLSCSGNQLATLDVSNNPALIELACSDNQLGALEIDNNTALTDLWCSRNRLTALDVSNNTKLRNIDCSSNQLTVLDLNNNPSLITLFCSNNKLAALDLSKNDMLAGSASNQNVGDQAADCTGGVYCFDMTKLMSKNQLKNVSFSDSSITMNGEGIVTLPWAVKSFTYLYDTSVDPDDGEIELPEIPTGNSAAGWKGYRIQMDVTVSLTYDGLPAFDGTIEWNTSDVKFNGKTPYVIANGKAQTPRFTVKDKNGKAVDPSHYTYQYRENKNAGTGYVIVTFKDLYTGTAQGWFKIYLPATDYTMVENRNDGIYMEWHAVDGAAGYVVYRRAWNLQSAGWTSFVRWNNTTDLHWTDTKVYAGTRYQYGVKAYFAQRVDPVSGATIGGNVGDNYNLGIVGPLKTTVRITTRTLNSVTGGSKQLTVKWSASKNFTGYEVQIATNAAFTKNVKTVKITNPKTAETTIKSLKAKTTYYARVRSYHVFEGTTYYGGWSNVRSAKTK